MIFKNKKVIGVNKGVTPITRIYKGDKIIFNKLVSNTIEFIFNLTGQGLVVTPIVDTGLLDYLVNNIKCYRGIYHEDKELMLIKEIALENGNQWKTPLKYDLIPTKYIANNKYNYIKFPTIYYKVSEIESDIYRMKFSIYPFDDCNKIFDENNLICTYNSDIGLCTFSEAEEAVTSRGEGFYCYTSDEMGVLAFLNIYANGINGDVLDYYSAFLGIVSNFTVGNVGRNYCPNIKLNNLVAEVTHNDGIVEHLNIPYIWRSNFNKLHITKYLNIIPKEVVNGIYNCNGNLYIDNNGIGFYYLNNSKFWGIAGDKGASDKMNYRCRPCYKGKIEEVEDIESLYPESHKIYYTTNDGNIVNVHSYWSQPIYNEYDKEKDLGIMVFDEPLNEVPGISGHPFLYGLTNLLTLKLPTTVKKLNWGCFYECKNLYKVNVEDLVLEELGYSCFEKTNIKTLDFRNSVFTELDGSLRMADKNRIIDYILCPTTVKSVNINLFNYDGMEDNTRIKTLMIPTLTKAGVFYAENTILENLIINKFDGLAELHYFNGDVKIWVPDEWYDEYIEHYTNNTDYHNWQDIVNRLRKYSDGVPEFPVINGYDYVDMGDAGIWCTHNIGASKPEEYGLYFLWGDTLGYSFPTEIGEGGFDWKNYKFSIDGSSTNFSKYNDKALLLELEDDAAHAIMGGDWRMPTREEFLNLIDLCDTEWVTNYEGTGINGRLFILKSDNSKKLFFPASGSFYGVNANDVGSYGYCWTTISSSGYVNNAGYLDFGNSSYQISFDSKRYGKPIRGILDKK